MTSSMTPLHILVAASLMPIGSVLAQETAPPEQNAWRFQLTPYVWMTGLEGRIRPFQGAPTAHVDKSFSAILSHLDAAFFLTGTARKGRLVLHGDVSHASTSDQAALPIGLPVRAHLRQTSATLAAGYNWQVDGQSSVDLLGGVRFWEIHARLDIPGVASANSKTSFADPVIAVRWRNDFAPQWSSLLYADAGGFGAGSKATWQLLGSINYQWKDNGYLSLGYRHLQVNYRSDGKRLDFSQGGPVVGATFRF